MITRFSRSGGPAAPCSTNFIILSYTGSSRTYHRVKHRVGGLHSAISCLDIQRYYSKRHIAAMQVASYSVTDCSIRPTGLG